MFALKIYFYNNIDSYIFLNRFLFAVFHLFDR